MNANLSDTSIFIFDVGLVISFTINHQLIFLAKALDDESLGDQIERINEDFITLAVITYCLLYTSDAADE